MAATFVFPDRGNYTSVATGGVVTIYDTLGINYTTSWDKVNITFGCRNPTGNWTPWDAPENPGPGSGSYVLRGLNSLGGMDRLNYPTFCNLRITRYKLTTDTILGQNFAVSNDSSVAAKTYTMGSSASSSSRSPTATTPLSSSTSVSSTGVSSTSTATSGANSEGSTTANQGLNLGAKIGIGIGAVVVVGILAALCWVMLVQRRVLRQMKQRESPQPEVVYVQQPLLPKSEPSRPSALVTSSTAETELPAHERQPSPTDRWSGARMVSGNYSMQPYELPDEQRG